MPLRKRASNGETQLFAIFVADLVGRYINENSGEQEAFPDFHILRVDDVEVKDLGNGVRQVVVKAKCLHRPTQLILRLSFEDPAVWRAWVYAEVYYPGDRPSTTDPRIWKGKAMRGPDGAVQLERFVYVP